MHVSIFRMFRVVLGAVAVIWVSSGSNAQEIGANLEETEAEIEERLSKITESLVSYQRCRIDRDCRENSFCYANDYNKVGLCKCKANYELLFRNRTYYVCLPFVNFGEECQLDGQCFDDLGPDARCNGKCGCKQGSVRYPWDGKCHDTVLLEDFCGTDANCILEDNSYAFCTDGQCQCNLGLRPSDDKKRCVPIMELGQACTDDNQCSYQTPNSVCREVCRCSMGYVLSRNQKRCLRAATYFEDPCEENAQCSEFLQDSICYGNCTCESGFHPYGASCFRSVNTGGSCRRTEQCVTSPKFEKIKDCIEGVCQCLPGVEDPNGSIGCNGNSFSLNFYLLGLCTFVFKLLFI